MRYNFDTVFNTIVYNNTDKNAIIQAKQQEWFDYFIINIVHVSDIKTGKGTYLDGLNFIAYALISYDYLDTISNMDSFYAKLISPEYRDYIDDQIKLTLKSCYLKDSDIDWTSLYETYLSPSEIEFDKQREFVKDTPIPIEVAIASISNLPDSHDLDNSVDLLMNEDFEHVAPQTIDMYVNENSFQDYDSIVNRYGRLTNGKIKYIEDIRSTEVCLSLSPNVHRLDDSKVWKVVNLPDGRTMTFYKSIPEVPELQYHVNVTTDPSIIKDSDYIHLFPTEDLKPRFEWMYKEIDNCYYHPAIGSVLPIEGYTEEQCIDNVIKYPYLTGLNRRYDDERGRVPLWAEVEVDGKLVYALKVWDTLSVSKLLPHSRKIVCEYFYRKYLLDRDYHPERIHFPVEGVIRPYLMLFLTEDTYTSLGYLDHLSMSKQCVQSRIDYIRSRNPILRQIDGDMYSFKSL
jgi:hypothetical protein